MGLGNAGQVLLLILCLIVNISFNQVIFDNVIHKLTLKDSNETIAHLGNDKIPPSSRDVVKSCFDNDVVTNFEVMVVLELIFRNARWMKYSRN